MKVLVCGGRNYQNAKMVAKILDAAVERLGLTSILQGGADGADRLAAEWAWDHGIPVGTMNADWKTYGKKAGPIRNQRMISEGKPDIVIAFPGGSGTANMVSLAEDAGIRVIKVNDSSVITGARQMVGQHV